MTKKVLHIFGGVVLGPSLMLQGCGPLLATGNGAAATAGTMAYVEGDLDTTYAVPLDRTWNAAMAALKEARFRVVDQKKDSAHATIKARREDHTPVTVSLDQAGPNTTSVKIRLGTFGDEEGSRAINRRITAHLGTAAGSERSGVW